ncbi:MAG: gamma-glutamyltransferase [Acidobacteriota bacterium]|jgi:gamma-glutamyltranspeptidase/glutathione hydrolase
MRPTAPRVSRLFPPFAIAALIAVTLALAPVAGAPAQTQRPEQGAKPVARAASGMVSTSHPDVTAVALEVLQNGGNAVDAMLTAIPFQHVVEPQMSNLAGGMGGLIYWAETGELIYLDAELDHTSNNPPAGQSYGSNGVPTTSGRRIGVPGTVAGLQAAAERYGTLPWPEYFGPAIDKAAEGFEMYSFLYGEMSAAFERLGAHEATREKWLRNGFVPPVGTVIRQPRLEATLRQLSQQGADYFYRGAWARHFVDEVNRTGGDMTMDDLAAYQVRWVEPVSFRYREYELRGAPPASTAGVLNGMILNILENFDLEAMGHYTESARALAILRAAYDAAESHTTRFIHDPNLAPVPVDLLLSKEYAGHIAELIEASLPAGQRTAGSVAAAPLLAAEAAAMVGDLYGDTDTNHMVIADADGNWVSMTHTVYGDTFGTGLVVDGVGVNSGNTFPGSGQAGSRRVITPFPALMAVDDAGAPWLAIGSPGLSSRAVALVLINYLGYGLAPEAAVDAPRFSGYGPGTPLQVESRIPETVLDGLGAYGIRVALSAPYNWHMGSIQLVVRDPATGELIGIADPRRGGYAAGY